MSRRWRIILMRWRGELLGFVDAADVQGAEAAAAAQFRLDDFQSRRLRGLVSRHRTASLENN